MSMSYRAHVMAVDRVERRLRLVTAALDDAEIPYAVAGGNAVAAWVGRVDPGATRATQDVDLVVQPDDLGRVTEAMERLGFRREDLRGLVLFLDPDEPSRRSGVHLIWSGQRVRPSYEFPAPTVDEADRDPEGFMVLDLPALVRMKLTSFRDIDRVHVGDMLRVGLIDEHVESSLPDQLRVRLAEIRARIDEEDDW